MDNFINCAWKNTTDKNLQTSNASSKFEDLRMLEHETIDDFNYKLCDIANEAFALGEKYSNTKIVRKTLRSLLERFAYKVAAIE